MKHRQLKLNHPDMSSSQNKPKGFTLIESTIAIVVLLVGLLAVMQFFPFSIQIIGDANNRTIASNLALSKLEEIKSQSYDDISTGTLEAKQVVSADSTSYLYNYQREAIVEFIDSNFDPSGSDVGLKKITVTVYWNSAVLNEEQGYSINSILADF